MHNLVESILTGNMILSNEIFEERMRQIVERKLLEVKRSIDISESKLGKGGDPTPDYTKPNTKADWAKYRKQHPSRNDPPNTNRNMFGKISADDLQKKKSQGYVRASDNIDDKGNIIKSFKKRVKTTRPNTIPKDFEKDVSDNTPKKAGSTATHPNNAGPGKMRSNWNTFRGRDSDDNGKNPDKKGRVGRAIRKVAGAAGIDTSKGALGIFGDALSAGRGPLS